LFKIPIVIFLSILNKVEKIRRISMCVSGGTGNYNYIILFCTRENTYFGRAGGPLCSYTTFCCNEKARWVVVGI